MSKKNIIITLIVIIAIAATGIGIKYTQRNAPAEQPAQTTETEAGKIGEGEVRITDDNFESEIKQYQGVALVDFYQPTCQYCIKMGPIISEVAKETQGKYKVGKLDVTANPKTVATLNNFRSVPALVIYKDGVEVDRLVGLQEKQAVLDKLEEVSKR